MTFQDVNGIVLMAKFQDLQWTTRQLEIDPVPGTGFALHPSYEANKADKIMLCHQKRNLSIGLGSYERGNLIESSRLMKDVDASSLGFEPQYKNLQYSPKRDTYCRCVVIHECYGWI